MFVTLRMENLMWKWFALAQNMVSTVSWCTTTVKTMAVSGDYQAHCGQLALRPDKSKLQAACKMGQYSDTSFHNDTTWQTQWVPAELSNMKMNKPDNYMWRPHDIPGPFQDDDSHPWTAIHRTRRREIRHRNMLKCTVTTNSTRR